MASPVNSTYVRKTNRQRVLQKIRSNAGISRQDLAEEIGLTPPAISGIVREWINKNVIIEEGRGESGGGRRPVRLVVNGGAALVLGAEFSRHQVRVSVTDMMGNIIEQQEWALDMTDPNEGICQFSEKIKALLEEPKYKDQVILGLGVATAGLYNCHTQKIQRSVNLGKGWDNFNILKLLESQISLPVRVENNAKACALAEYWVVQEEKIDDLVWIHLGEGISAGVIQKGDWLRGRSNYSGEIGHISLHFQGELCNCGNYGCLEAYWGWQGLKKRLAKDDFFEKMNLDAEKFKMKDWVQLVEARDPYAVQLSEEMGRDIGKIVSQIINLLNPSRIFLGGPMAQSMAYSLGSLVRIVKQEAFPEVAGEAQISVSKMGNYAASLGGCSLILQEFFLKSNSDIFNILEGE